MTTPLHNFRRILRTPEWQAFKRQCVIEGNPDAELAEQRQHIDQRTLNRFVAFASYQRELHIKLLAQRTTA